jgi:hypothetical protein
MDLHTPKLVEQFSGQRVFCLVRGDTFSLYAFQALYERVISVVFVIIHGSFIQGTKHIHKLPCSEHTAITAAKGNKGH